MQPNLRSAIFLAGKTQRAIALRARIPEARLSAIIRGRAAATRDEKARLAAALGAAVDQLFPAEQALAS